MVNDEGDATKNTKLLGYDFYCRTLGSPRYVVAPMVDQSELAWRMLCRRYGAQLCYSPMYHANLFAHDPKYRKDALQTCAEDRPLIIQFCGNDAEQILDAALLAQEHCDAVDINLGCPQAIAKRGHYGSFLQDEWELLTDIVRTLHEKLSVPVTCKIRIFEDREKTLRYAKMLEAAGCQLLTVHGRTREQKGPLTGVADWSYIKELRQHLKIPMFANGNILGLEDVHRCLDETGVDGVMSAEGNLHNPAIFQGIAPPVWQMAKEYLEFVELYPCPSSYIRGHLFKLFHHIMNIRQNSELRDTLATSNQLEQFQAVVDKVQAKYEPYHRGEVVYVPEEMDATISTDKLELNAWLCQPYIRASPESHRQKIAEKELEAVDPNRAKRQYFDKDGNEISRKRMKKLRRRQRRPNKTEAQVHQRHERRLQYCTACANPQGSKCEFNLCRVCCKDKCYGEDCDCPGHGILIKSRRAKAKQYQEHSKLEENSHCDVLRENLDSDPVPVAAGDVP